MAAAGQRQERLGQRLSVHERRFTRRAVEDLGSGRSILLLDHAAQSIINRARVSVQRTGANPGTGPRLRSGNGRGMPPSRKPRDVAHPAQDSDVTKLRAVTPHTVPW